MNVASCLSAAAARRPDAAAIIAPSSGGSWRTVTFRELDSGSDAIAHGLSAHGFRRGELTLVMVRAGIELISITYALFKLGAVPVLIDPGMGRSAFLRCVEQTRATALVGIPLAHAARLAFRSSFRTIERHVTVGARWLWSGPTLEALARNGRTRGAFPLAETADDDTAAVLFTSGSTGPAKGVVYSHGMFLAQVEALRATYRFAPGEIDLAAFPLFSLFDCALEMTSVIPDLDPSRPGTCDPSKVVAALQTHRATTAFGSPAIWRRVAPWCLAHGVRLPHLKRVLIAGASVAPAIIEQLHLVVEGDADVETPYGATESLPVASITGREVVLDTAARSREGAGTCVGRPVAGVAVRVTRITDDVIPTWSDELCVPQGAVGEICVRGAVVTRAYHNRPDATAAAKIADGRAVWHRMGDLGYFDASGRLWFCGRKGERVETARGPLYTDRVEGLFSGHPRVARCALVGVGKSGSERPVLVVEGSGDASLAEELRLLGLVEAVLFHPRFPVDVRHNAKIHRRALKAWAEARLRGRQA